MHLHQVFATSHSLIPLNEETKRQFGFWILAWKVECREKNLLPICVRETPDVLNCQSAIQVRATLRWNLGIFFMEDGWHLWSKASEVGDAISNGKTARLYIPKLTLRLLLSSCGIFMDNVNNVTRCSNDLNEVQSKDTWDLLAVTTYNWFWVWKILAFPDAKMFWMTWSGKALRCKILPWGLDSVTMPMCQCQLQDFRGMSRWVLFLFSIFSSFFVEFSGWAKEGRPDFSQV